MCSSISHVLRMQSSISCVNFGCVLNWNLAFLYCLTSGSPMCSCNSCGKNVFDGGRNWTSSCLVIPSFRRVSHLHKFVNLTSLGSNSFALDPVASLLSKLTILCLSCWCSCLISLKLSIVFGFVAVMPLCVAAVLSSATHNFSKIIVNLSESDVVSLNFASFASCCSSTCFFSATSLARTSFDLLLSLVLLADAGVAVAAGDLINACTCCAVTLHSSRHVQLNLVVVYSLHLHAGHLILPINLPTVPMLHSDVML